MDDRRSAARVVLSAGGELDFRHFADGYVATAADIDEELKRIGYALKPLDIVVVNTSAGAKYGRSEYLASGCGIGAEEPCIFCDRASG